MDIEFEIISRTLLAMNCFSYTKILGFFKNNSQLVFGDIFYTLYVIEINKRGKILFPLRGLTNFLNLVKVFYSKPIDVIITSTANSYIKFWSYRSKKCLGSRVVTDIINSFIVYEAKIIFYDDTVGLIFMNFMGKIVRKIKAVEEMDVCNCMLVHQENEKGNRLLIYGGVEGFIVVRNMDDSFKVIAKIPKRKQIIAGIKTFFDGTSGITKLFVTDLDGKFYMFDMRDYSPIKIKKNVICDSCVLFWSNFLIFGSDDEVCIYKFGKETIKRVFKTTCEEELEFFYMLNVKEEKEETGLKVIVTSGLRNIYLYHIRCKNRK